MTITTTETTTNLLSVGVHVDAADRAMALLDDGRGRAIVPVRDEGEGVVAIDVESSETRIATREIARDDADAMIADLTGAVQEQLIDAIREYDADDDYLDELDRASRLS